MGVNGTLGSKLFISNAAIASTIDTEEEFAAQSYTEVGIIENFGEFGRVFENVKFQAVADGRTFKFKGPFDDGQMQFTLGQDLSDAGQALLKSAANEATQNNYGFRIELNDPPSSVGGPTTFFFRGLAMSFKTQMGAANTVVKAMGQVEVNSPILSMAPAALYDRFTSGSLAAYALFHGSDGTAASPALSGTTLVAVTGAGSPGTVAVNGSEAFGATGYNLATGALVYEIRCKLSAITNVAAFLGFGDQKAALAFPIEGSGTVNGLTNHSSNAVGFLFDTKMSTANIWGVGVDATTGATAQNSSLAFSANTDRTLRIEVTTGGVATFYIDGVAIGSGMTGATAATTLYPVIAAASRGTASRSLTTEYLYVRQG